VSVPAQGAFDEAAFYSVRSSRAELRALRLRRWCVPIWRATAAFGFFAGALLWVALARARDLSGVAVAGTIAINLSTFVFLQHLSARLFRSPRTVLLEHSVLAGGATFLVGIVTAVPMAPLMDAWTAALCLTLGIGRIGCLFGGCCHGRPCFVGPRYPWKIPPAHRGALQVVRLAPVQAVESGLLIAMCALHPMVVSRLGQGAVLPAFVLVYGVGRILLELARGDSHRRYLGRLSEAQLWCLAAVGSLIFFRAWRPAALVTLGLLTLVGLLLRRHVGPSLFPISSARFATTLAGRGALLFAFEASTRLVMPNGLTLESCPAGALLLHPRRHVGRATAAAVARLIPDCHVVGPGARKGTWLISNDE
jgi:prolipoprotein diacylglyceryltransferase